MRATISALAAPLLRALRPHESDTAATSLSPARDESTLHARAPGDPAPLERPLPLRLTVREEPTRRRGPERTWDLYLRSTAVLGLAGIAWVLAVPAAGVLVGLAIYTLWVTGPLSPLFPVGLEPVVMLLGRLHRPVLVAAVVTAAGLHAEFLSYHLYRAALRGESLGALRSSRFLKRIQRWFERAPFWTVWFLSWSPLPYWGGRILAAMTGYSLARYLGATCLGRFPKFWLFAALGLQWEVPGGILVAVACAGTLLSLVILLLRRRGEEPQVEVGGRTRGARRLGGAPEAPARREGFSERRDAG